LVACFGRVNNGSIVLAIIALATQPNF